MTKGNKPFWNPLRVVVGVMLMFVLVGLALWLYLQGKDVSVWNPQGIVAEQQRDLMVFTLLLSAIVVVPVYVMLFAFAWRYREHNPKKVKYTPHVGGNRLIETVWWGIPIIIIGILSVVTWVSTHQLDPYRALDSKEEPLRVQVVALQWKWLFIYPDYHVASLNELTIPANVPVNFEITADGPMSAFWIPSLGSQTYAMTGMTAQLSLMANNAGTFRGSNSNISGEGYSDMYFDVNALSSRTAFYDWVKGVVSSSCHRNLALDEYEELAKPDIAKKPIYYHLHDDNLYAKVVDKYMGHGMHTVGTDMSAHTHIDMHNDNHHNQHGGSICGED